MSSLIARYKLATLWVGVVLYCSYVWTIWDLTR